MSIALMSAVWEAAPFSQTELLVLLALADHAGDDGTCWPSVPRLAQRARTSERHVQRILDDLERRGWITREVRVNQSSVFRLTPPKPVDNPTPQGGDTQVTPGVTPRSPGGDTQVTPGVTPRSPRTTREPSLEPSSQPPPRRRRPEPVDNLDPLTAQGLDETGRTAFTRWLKDTGARNPCGLIRTLARDGTLGARIAEWRADKPRPSFWDREVPTDRQAVLLRQEMTRAQAADEAAEAR